MTASAERIRDPENVSKHRPNKYSVELRSKVVEYAEQHGFLKAAAEFHLNSRVVARWLRIRQREKTGPGPTRTHAKRRIAELSKQFADLPRHQRKELLANELLKLAAEWVDRLRSPDTKQVATNSGAVVKIEQEHLDARDVKDLTLAIAVVVDKSVLLAGEATSRHEHVDVTELEKALNDAIADPAKRRALALRVLGGTKELPAPDAETIKHSPHTAVRVPRKRPAGRANA